MSVLSFSLICIMIGYRQWRVSILSKWPMSSVPVDLVSGIFNYCHGVPPMEGVNTM